MIVIVLSMVMMFLISACGSTAVSETPMSNSTSVASLSYISSGFIDAELSTYNPDSYNPTFLSTVLLDKPGTTTTKVEGEIGYVNIYLDKLKIFMDDGFDAIEVDQDVESDNPDYDFMFSYTVEEEDYIIYYNYDEEISTSEGILIVDEVTYNLQIEDNLKEGEGGESKRNLILTATNGDNWITIDYELKTDGDDTKQYLEVTRFIEGVESLVTIEIKADGDSFKVSIEDGDNSYDFKVEVSAEGTHYKLDYIVDGVDGTAKIYETVNEDGDFVYDYKITEGDVITTIEKTPPGQDKKNND